MGGVAERIQKSRSCPCTARRRWLPSRVCRTPVLAFYRLPPFHVRSGEGVDVAEDEVEPLRAGELQFAHAGGVEHEAAKLRRSSTP